MSKTDEKTEEIFAVIDNENPLWHVYGMHPELGRILEVPSEAEIDLRRELEKRHYTEEQIRELVGKLGKQAIGLPHIKEFPGTPGDMAKLYGTKEFNTTKADIVWDNPRFIISKSQLEKTTPDPMMGKSTGPHELAGGGRGVLIEGFDMTLGVPVMIKTSNPIHYYIYMPDFINKRIMNEALATSKREQYADADVSVVSVYDAGLIPTIDDRFTMPFFVMRKIDGFNLDEATTYDTRSVIDITNKLSRAIDEQNNEGIYHRDLKPGNIMMGNDGRLYLIDWDCSSDAANIIDSENEQGTPSYRAPEQKNGINTNKSEQHALAATAWQLLRGHSPAWRDTFRTGTRFDDFLTYEHIDHRQELAKPAAMGAEVYAVFVKAMSFNPEDRYDSCREFAEALSTAYEQSKAA